MTSVYNYTQQQKNAAIGIDMLKAGRSLDFVKKITRLTFKQMEKWAMIGYVDSPDPARSGQVRRIMQNLHAPEQKRQTQVWNATRRPRSLHKSQMVQSNEQAQS